MIKVILWDIDGTLLDFLSAEKTAIQEAYQALPFGTCTDAMAKRYSEINLGYWKKLERGEVTKPELLLRRFQDFLRDCGNDPSYAGVLCSTYETCLGEAIFYNPHALETLEALRDTVLQCAVTNGTKKVQDRKLAKSGIAPLLDHIFISETVGFEKPRKEFFDIVLQTIGNYSLSEVLIVGDSLTSDMQGGVNSGIKTCLYDPLHNSPTTKLPIDHCIHDLSDVIQIIESS